MKPFPFTKVLGAIACVAGVVTKGTEAKYPAVSYWAHLTFMCCAALGLWFARNNGTTSEQAIGITATDASRAAATSKP
jgi:uncharacterized membrane protein YhhN